MKAAQSFIRIGRIVGVHGLRGALKFRPDNPDSQAIATLERILIAADVEIDTACPPDQYRVTGCAPLGRGMSRLAIEGVAEVERARKLRGAIVMASPDDLPGAAEHEFYHYEAVGCEVTLTDGRRVGTIEEVLVTGANDVFVVRETAATKSWSRLSPMWSRRSISPPGA